MRKFCGRLILVLVVSCAIAVETGCGPNDTGSFDNPTPTPDPKPKPVPSDFAPDSIGGSIINGHIGGTSTVWQIVTTGSKSGTFNYSENGNHLENGTYTWTKTSANTAILSLSPDNTSIDFTYTGPNVGNYVFHPNANYTETGTFTTN